ncbi:MAG: protein kinase [Pseudomonadota bacterium]
MRVLVIDDAVESLVWIERALRQTLPQAAVVLWNPERQGRPPADFDWERYDALLLGETPCPGEDALAWLGAFLGNAGFPPVIVLAEGAGEDYAVRTIRAGAFEFLRKSEVTPLKLALALKESQLEAKGAAAGPVHPETVGEPADGDGISIPGYRILRRIGQGGMAKVYLAERIYDGLQLVLKVLDPRIRRDPEWRARLEREYRIIQRIRNEHVAVVYDQGFDGDHSFIAMEYFAGGDLQQRIQAGMSSMAALKTLVQIAKALDAVHSADVIHRDLKPQNIMFRANNRLAILDFGLAREASSTATLTQKGVVIATPLYMSPEQCLGLPHDARGDLYSVGVILYEMLTGQHMYTGENATQLAYQHVHGPIPKLPPRLAGYQPLLERLVAKDPAKRFQSARELYNFIVH